MISRVLQTGRINQAISAGLRSEHLHKHRQEWEYLVKFHAKHSEVPSVKVFEERFPDFRYTKTTKKTVRIKPAVDSVIDNHVAISLARALKDATEGLDEKPAADIVEELNATLTSLARTQAGDEDFNIAADFDTDYAEFMRLRTAIGNDDTEAMIATPWPAINEEFGGWLPGTVTGVLARPNVGKSWLIDQAAVIAALAGNRTYLASLEMKRRQTVARIHTIASFYMAQGKKGKRYRRPKLPAILDLMAVEALFRDKGILRNSHLSRMQDRIDPKEYHAFGKRFEAACSGGFFMPDINRRSQAFTLEAFITKLERTEAEIGFLDYFGLLEMERQAKGAQRWEGWSKMSARLKMAAEHLDIPIVVALQANRNGALVKTPEVPDIADSDAIARDLDNLISLAEGDDGLWATVIKHRNGRKNFRFPIHFYPDYGIVEQNMHAEVEYDIL